MMSGKTRACDRPARQRRTDTAIAMLRVNGQWPEQERRPPRPGGNVPKPNGAGEPAVMNRDE
jgi:hypothetical protein